MAKSLWLSYSDDTDFTTLISDLTVDVTIIGGGIAGVTTADLLSQQGFRVAVLEKDQVGCNSTGNSTGNLYGAVSEILLSVRKKFGLDAMKKVVASRLEAIDLIQKNVENYKIDCDFKRVDWHYYTAIPETEKKIEDAFSAAKEAGLVVAYSQLNETPYVVRKGITISGAAQFNPLRYVQGLARTIRRDECFIFENSEVKEIISEGEKHVVKVNNGSTVTSNFLIHASHTPKGIMIFHTELGPYREYGIACKIRGDQHPSGIYFGYFDPGYITSTRLYERHGEQYLIVVGEPHKVGHEDNLYHMNRLEAFAREHFDVSEVTHRWGAQNYKPADYLPYIGPKGKGSSIFVATGFSSHGLTYGTVAGQVLADQISGKGSQYTDLYLPYRFNPIKAAPKFIKENVDVFAQFVKDYMLKKNRDDFGEVGPGQGRIVEKEGHQLAVYRSDEGELKVCSAVCTHMGCIVHWNNAENSWDCPCHGSRFGTDGEVIEGPALKALAKMAELTDKPRLKVVTEIFQETGLNQGL